MVNSTLKYIGLSLLLTFIMASCKPDPKKQQIKAITSLEKELYSSEILDRKKGLHIIDTYVNYSKQYPKDTLSANYLYKAAEVAMNLQLGSQSIFYFDNIITNYPDFRNIAECFFLKAFLYETQLNNISEAELLYREFIDRFPNHPMVKDAEASIKYLGKSPEELVRMFEEMNTTKQTNSAN